MKKTAFIMCMIFFTSLFQPTVAEPVSYLLALFSAAGTYAMARTTLTIGKGNITDVKTVMALLATGLWVGTSTAQLVQGARNEREQNSFKTLSLSLHVSSIFLALYVGLDSK